MESKIEKYISDYTRKGSNELEYVGTTCKVYQPWLTPDQALRAAEIAKEETIEKACDWLENFYSEDRYCFLVKEDIEAFKQAMEE